jgi:hypothetical protein
VNGGAGLPVVGPAGFGTCRCLEILFWIGIGRLIRNIPINNTAQNAIKAKNREVNCTKLQGRATAIQVTPIKEAQEAQ